jgi:hypothetical protein
MPKKYKKKTLISNIYKKSKCTKYSKRDTKLNGGGGPSASIYNDYTDIYTDLAKFNSIFDIDVENPVVFNGINYELLMRLIDVIIKQTKTKTQIIPDPLLIEKITVYTELFKINIEKQTNIFNEKYLFLKNIMVSKIKNKDAFIEDYIVKSMDLQQLKNLYDILERKIINISKDIKITQNNKKMYSDTNLNIIRLKGIINYIENRNNSGSGTSTTTHIRPINPTDFADVNLTSNDRISTAPDAPTHTPIPTASRVSKQLPTSTSSRVLLPPLPAK